MTSFCRTYCAAALMVSMMASASGETRKPIKRQFPAQLEVTSSRLLDDGHQEVEVCLALEKNVQIYANPVGEKDLEFMAIQTVVIAKDGNKISAKVVYPKPSRVDQLDELGSASLYTDDVTMRVRFNPENHVGLKVRCEFVGWNSARACCLGKATLEANLSGSK